MNEEKIWLQQKGHFSHPGQKGRCLSTTRGLSVHVPDPCYRQYVPKHWGVIDKCCVPDFLTAVAASNKPAFDDRSVLEGKYLTREFAM